MEQQPLDANEAKLAQPKAPLHKSDPEDDDENVKQLDECSSLYLLMQGDNFILFFIFP
ncbi:Cox19-like CHCH family protein, putative [Medicago truncatula]|uniref:Cox19-like CHCH family protein, putative n=1 Tax=Medicago truncatula TaxID=3880 RepID=A0A072VEZ3_MEDTR|nr:Cox19-like CHCH family protein, putative [Medicago truncatula]